MSSLTKVLLALSLASTDAWFQKTFCSYWEERDGKCMCQRLPAEIATQFGSSTEGLETNTQWLVQPEQILTYPCSRGYLGNAAANYELEHDMCEQPTVVTLPTRPRSRSLSLLLFTAPYFSEPSAAVPLSPE